MPGDRALRLVRFFSILSIFLPWPESLRVLTHLIVLAVSGLWHGAKTAPCLPAAAMTKPSNCGMRHSSSMTIVLLIVFLICISVSCGHSL